jgi:hypothetical protein
MEMNIKTMELFMDIQRVHHHRSTKKNSINKKNHIGKLNVPVALVHLWKVKIGNLLFKENQKSIGTILI